MDISVIIPAYNAEKTLSDTLNDVLNQTFKNFELIIVNDGSSDNTLDICTNYSKKDSRIKYINQSNSGLSASRNNAVKIAIGKYVTFVDADDRIEKEYLEMLFNAIKETKADFSVGKIDRTKEGTGLTNKVLKPVYKVTSVKEALREMSIGKGYSIGACCKLGLRDLYLKYPFLVDKYYEDLSNTYKIIMACNSIAFVDCVLYHYVMRGGSITGSRKVSKKQCLDYFEAINIFKENVLKTYPEIESDISILNFKDYISLYLSINRCDENNCDELKKIKKYVKRWMKINWKTVANNKNSSISDKLRITLFVINSYIYEKLYYFAIRIKGKAIN